MKLLVIRIILRGNLLEKHNGIVQVSFQLLFVSVLACSYMAFGVIWYWCLCRDWRACTPRTRSVDKEVAELVEEEGTELRMLLQCFEYRCNVRLLNES